MNKLNVQPSIFGPGTRFSNNAIMESFVVKLKTSGVLSRLGTAIEAEKAGERPLGTRIGALESHQSRFILDANEMVTGMLTWCGVVFFDEPFERGTDHEERIKEIWATV